MPFVVQDSESRRPAQPPSRTTRLPFTGREREIGFVQVKLVEPDRPHHNIVCLHGQGGIGKTTLLRRLESLFSKADQPSQANLFATVDERQSSPLAAMRAFARGLKLKGEFDSALNVHVETLRRLREDRESAAETLGAKATSQVAKLIADSLPVAGHFIEQGAEAASNYIWSRVGNRQHRKDIERLDEPLRDLTHAFVQELNRLAKRKTGPRIFLCFDTFEQAGDQIELWLLDLLLEESIDPDIVLIVAGRLPLTHLERPTSARWLELKRHETLHELQIDTFTREETIRFLSHLRVEEQVADRVWNLSHGLPIFVSMLASTAESTFDPTSSVVQNFLRGIPSNKLRERKLVLEAALLSRPFTRDDLKAFTYVSEDEREPMFAWLLAQPFVLPYGSRHLYHEEVRNLLQRYFHQRSPEDCRLAREAIAARYTAELSALEQSEGGRVYESVAWVDLALALVVQRILLPKVQDHASAVDLVVRSVERRKSGERKRRALRVLCELEARNGAQLTAPGNKLLCALREYVSETEDSSSWHEAVTTLVQALSSGTPELARSVARLHLARADRLRGEGRLLDALQCCDDALAVQPDYAEAWNHRGYLLAELKRLDDAVDACTRAVRIDSSHVYAHFNLGFALGMLGHMQEALASFEDAIRLRPGFADAHFNRGAILFTLGRREEAGAAIDAALASESVTVASARGRFSKGYLLNQLNRNEEAIAAFEEAIVIDARFAPARLALGELLLDLKRPEAAWPHLKQAVWLDPNNSAAWISQGYCSHDLGRYEEAIASLVRATEINPGSAPAWNNLGYAFAAVKRFDKSLDAFAKSRGADPTYSNPWRGQGRTLLEQGRLQEALESFDQALKVNASYVGARYDRAGTLARMGRDVEALAAYSLALQVQAPTDDCYAAAQAFLERMTIANPLNANAWGCTGKLAMHMNQPDRARLAYAKSIEIDPAYRFRSTWSSGLDRKVSPDMVEDQFLDVDIVILIQGANNFGDQIYSYVELNGRSLKAMFEKMANGEEFKPGDFGKVHSEGTGEPPEDVKTKLEREFNMIPVPAPQSQPPIIPSLLPEGDEAI